MKTTLLRAFAFAVLAVSVLPLGQGRCDAAVLGEAEMSFTNFQMSAKSGTIQFLGDWSGGIFARAGDAAQWVSGVGVPLTADAVGAYTRAHGQLFASSGNHFDISGLSRCSVFPTTQPADYEFYAAHTSLYGTFMLTGGTGPVDLTYSIDLAERFSFQPGATVAFETFFCLEQDGSPVLFHREAFDHSISEINLAQHLTTTVSLEFGRKYFLFLGPDPNPEPTTNSLLLLGLATWAFRKYRRRAKVGSRTKASQITSLALWFGTAALLLDSRPARAHDTTSGVTNCCCICCPLPTQSAISLSRGNLSDEHEIASLRNSSGSTIDFSLNYNSASADGSWSSINTGMGYGWTHSFNLFLFRQRSHVFRMDGNGQVTKFSYGPGGQYTVQPGFFDTLVQNPDGSFTITNKQKAVFQFASIPDTPFLVEGPVFRLVSVTDRNQNTTTLSYTNGNLVRITDTYGRSLSLAYTNTNRLWTITDPLGRTTTLQYDAPGRRLLSITDPLGKSIQVTYNSMYQMVQKIDKDGRAFSYEYSNGKPAAIRDGAGNYLFRLSNALNWAYDPVVLASNLVCEFVPSTTSHTDGRGNQWQHSYDKIGFITKTIAPDGSVLRHTHDPLTFGITAITNANGVVTTSQYDALGNLTSTTDALGNTNSYTYEPVFNQMTSMTDPNGRTTTWQYDARGNRTNEIAPMGFTRSWTYDSHGNVLTEKDRNGNVTRHFYDHFGNRTNTTDALTNVTRFTFDAVGNLLSHTDANNHASTNAYDALNRLVSVTTGLIGPVPSPLRQANLHLELQSLSDGTLQFQWDQPGTVLTRAASLAGPFEDVCVGSLPATSSPYVVPSPQTNVAEFYRLRADPAVLIALGYELPGTGTGTSGSGGQTGSGGGRQPKDGPGGDTTTYGYDNEGHRTAVTNCNGAVTRYEYDLRKRLVKVTDALGYTVSYAYDNNDNRIAVTNQNGFVTRYEYDSQNRLVRTIDALNCVSTSTYDSVGNVLIVTDANGHTTSYAYDALNRRTASINALGGVTQFEYANPSGGTPCCSPTYGSSLVTKQTDANGKVTYFKYDALDRLTRVIRKQTDTADLSDPNTDPDDAITAYTYDPNGNRLTVATRISATEYLTNGFGYDALNRPIASTNGAGDFTLTTYDPVGNVRVVQAPNLNLTTNTYDAHDRLIQVDDRIGRVASYTHDCVGNRLSVTDGNTNTTAYAYDALNRPISTTDAMLHPTRYFYDPVGNLTNVVDRMTNASRYAYDPLNRRTNNVDAIGCVTVYAYDCVGNLLAITDANNHTTSYEYDALNRLVKEIYPDLPGPGEPPDSNKRFFAYDPVGNVTSRVDQKGNTTLYRYSDLYFLTNRSYVSDPSDRFSYDLAGRMLTASKTNWLTTNDWVVTFAYDGASRVTNTTQGGRVIAYGYNIPGRTRALTYPSGTNILETTDVRGRLWTVNDGGVTPIATYTYDRGNRVLTRTYRNGVVADYAYNPNNWITSLLHTNPTAATLIAGFTYAYDQEGNKRYEENLWNTNRSEAYAYDPIYRLTNWMAGRLVGGTVPSPTNTQAWQLDCLGNWNTTITNGVPEYRTHDAANEISTIQADGGQVVPVYHDYNGNLTNDGRYAYAYDNENRLAKATRLFLIPGDTGPRLVGQYAYDALGRRIAKIADPDPAISPSASVYLHDHARIVEEQTPLRVTAATWTVGRYVDEVLVSDRKGQTHYHHQNSVWSVVALSDELGIVHERYDYTAYGCHSIMDGVATPLPPNAWATPHSSIANTRFFTGREFEEEAPLLHYRTRTYAPSGGRFAQRDSLDRKVGMNPYEYAFSSPVNYADPFGRQAYTIEKVEGILIVTTTSGNVGKLQVFFSRVVYPTGEPFCGGAGGCICFCEMTKQLKYCQLTTTVTTFTDPETRKEWRVIEVMYDEGSLKDNEYKTIPFGSEKECQAKCNRDLCIDKFGDLDVNWNALSFCRELKKEDPTRTLSFEP